MRWRVVRPAEATYNHCFRMTYIERARRELALTDGACADGY